MIRLGSFLLPLLWVAWGCGTQKSVPDASSKAIDTASLRELYYAAELHYVQGNWKQADSLFKKYMLSGLPAAPAYHRMACIAAKTGKTDYALDWNSKAIRTDSTVEEWLWLQADLLRRKGDYKNVGDIYARYTLKHPRSWTCYTDAAKYYSLGGEWTAMLTLCQRWEKEFGLLEPIVEYQSQALNMMDEPVKAAEKWAALSSKYPDRRNYRYKQVSTLIDGNEPEAASRLLDSLISKDPDNPELQILLCKTMGNRSWTNLPSQFWQIAQSKKLSLDSKWECLEYFNNPIHNAYDSSELLWRKLHEAHPNEPTALNALGLWCLFHGKHTEAAGFLKASIQDGEQNLMLWQQYMTALSYGCETLKAVSQSDSLTELYPLIPAGYRMKAIAAFIHNNLDEGLLFCIEGENFTENDSALSALKSYISLHIGIPSEKPNLDYYFSDSSINTDALMVNVEWALTQNQLAEAGTMLNALFGSPKILKEIRYKGYNTGDCWSFFQCVLQQARLAVITRQHQQASIALLKKYMPENAVALELMGDLYDTDAENALSSYQKALLCSSFPHKNRVNQKIFKLKNR